MNRDRRASVNGNRERERAESEKKKRTEGEVMPVPAQLSVTVFKPTSAHSEPPKMTENTSWSLGTFSFELGSRPICQHEGASELHGSDSTRFMSSINISLSSDAHHDFLEETAEGTMSAERNL